MVLVCDNWFDLLASHSLLSEGPDIAQGDRPPVTRGQSPCDTGTVLG